MGDYLLKGEVGGGMATVLVCTSTGLVEKCRKNHDLSPLSSCVLGRALTLAALVAGLLKEKQNVSLQILCEGAARGLFAQCDWLGNVRGYIQEAHLETWLTPEGKFDVPRAIGGGFLYVVKDLGLKAPYVGSVPIVHGGLASDLAYYFAQSEQIPSAVGCGVFVGSTGRVEAAGGYLIQRTAGAPREIVDILEQNIQQMLSPSELIRDGLKPEDFFPRLAKPLSFQIADSLPLKFRCPCTRYRARNSILLLGERVLREMIATDKSASVQCRFCGKEYLFAESDLSLILSKIVRDS